MRHARLLIRAMLVVFGAATTCEVSALDIQWDGSGTPPFGSNSESWQNVDNWAPSGSPFSVHRVPGDGDNAIISAPGNDQVQLDATTAPINGLSLVNGNRLRTNGHLLRIDNTGAGVALVGGANANLLVEPRLPSGNAFETDNLILGVNGTLSLAGGKALVEGSTEMRTGSRIVTSGLTPGTSGLVFGGNLSLVAADINLAAPIDLTFGTGATISLHDDSEIRVQQTLEFDRGQTVQVFDSDLTSNGGRVANGSSVELSTTSAGSIWEVGGELQLDDAAIQVGANSSLEGFSRIHASDNATLTTQSILTFTDPTESLFETGAFLDASNTVVRVQTTGPPAVYSELRFDGEGAGFDIGDLLVGGINRSARVVMANGASGIVDNVEVGHGSNPNNVFGDVTVVDQADLEITGNVLLGSSGNSINSNGAVLVADATVRHTGTGIAVVGTPAGPGGLIQILSGGVYSGNATTLVVQSEGRILVEGRELPGVMSLPGSLQVEGSVNVETSTAGFLGGELHVASSILINGGTITLAEGIITAGTVAPTLGGNFNFDGGQFSASLYDGDLTNNGGTLAPGTTAAGDAPGEMQINGRYDQTVGATLALEIAGMNSGSDHDFVDVADTAILNGDLSIALVDGFLPSSSQTFSVLDALTIAGQFDNVANGQRLTTLHGLGSFLVSYGGGSPFDPSQIVLSEFQAASADVDQDGDVDGHDFLLIQRTNPALIPLWAAQYPQSLAALDADLLAVPEPTTAGLALLALTAVVVVNDRRLV